MAISAYLLIITLNGQKCSNQNTAWQNEFKKHYMHLQESHFRSKTHTQTASEAMEKDSLQIRTKKTGVVVLL